MSIAPLTLETSIGFSGTVPRGLVVHPNREHILYPLGSTVVAERIGGKKAQQFFLGLSSNVSCVAVSNTGRFVAAGQVTHTGFNVRDLVIRNMHTHVIAGGCADLGL